MLMKGATMWGDVLLSLDACATKSNGKTIRSMREMLTKAQSEGCNAPAKIYLESDESVCAEWRMGKEFRIVAHLNAE